jgi:hypothetical protein
VHPERKARRAQAVGQRRVSGCAVVLL